MSVALIPKTCIEHFCRKLAYTTLIHICTFKGERIRLLPLTKYDYAVYNYEILAS